MPEWLSGQAHGIMTSPAKRTLGPKQEAGKHGGWGGLRTSVCPFPSFSWAMRVPGNPFTSEGLDFLVANGQHHAPTAGAGSCFPAVCCAPAPGHGLRRGGAPLPVHSRASLASAWLGVPRVTGLVAGEPALALRCSGSEAWVFSGTLLPTPLWPSVG